MLQCTCLHIAKFTQADRETPTGMIGLPGLESSNLCKGTGDWETNLYVWRGQFISIGAFL